MKKLVAVILTLCLALTAAFGLTACGGGDDTITIAIPNDTSNEARALLILQEQGLITVDPDAGITATITDITDNPYGIEFSEVEAAQLPNVLQDVDYAVINSNFAIDAGLSPSEALVLEGAYSAYGNILAVKAGNEEKPEILALKAALESQQVADFIEETYGKDILSTVDVLTDGYDAAIDYAALEGTTIKVGASPAPHAEILGVVKDILAEKGITLEIVEFNDYVLPNTAVDTGEIDANYFQHLPYLETFNDENGTDIVSISTIHVEPMGVYGGQQTSLDAIK